MTLTQKPIIVDGEQLFFSDVENDLILLSNDFNKRLTRGCIALWPEKRFMILGVVTSDMRKCQYKDVVT